MPYWASSFLGGQIELGTGIVVRESGYGLPQRGEYAVVFHQLMAKALLQIGTVNRGVRGTITRFKCRTQAQLPQRFSALRITHKKGIGKGCRIAQRTGQTPAFQNTGDMGPQLNARTHLGQHFRFFKHLNAVPGTTARQRRSQTPNASACDQNAQGLRHGVK